MLKINIPRSDGGMDVVMGDLVLMEDEVNPVMSALLDNGIAVTALHNHFFWDSPRMFYMHVHAHGRAADIAAKLKPALGAIGANRTAPSTRSPSGAPICRCARWARRSTRGWA